MKLLSVLLALALASSAVAQISETAAAVFPFDGATADQVQGVDIINFGNFTYVENRFGTSGAAIDLNSILDYGVPDFGKVDSSDFSVSVWFKKDGSLWQITPIINKKAQGGESVITTEGFGIQVQDWIGSTSTAQSLFRSGTDSNYATAFIGGVSDLSQPGDWHHMVVVVDRDSTMRTYFDNAFVLEINIEAHAAASEVVDNAPLIVGSSNMTLDDLYFFDYALDADDVDELFGGVATSVSETEAVSISVYPNPVGSTLHVQGTTKEPVSVRIVTMDGRIIEESSLQMPGVLDTSQWAAGIYAMQLFVGTKVEVIQVCKR